MQDKSCKTSRWRLLKAQLNNLAPADFSAQIKAAAHPVVIDVRMEKEFTLGHIPDAIHIDYFDEGPDDAAYVRVRLCGMVVLIIRGFLIWRAGIISGWRR